MVKKAVGVICAKVEKYMRGEIAKYVGPDPDAHFMMYLEKKYPTAASRDELKRKVDVLIEPKQHAIAHVPNGKCDSFTTSIMQYVMGRAITPKALPKMADMWERLEQLFPDGLRTHETKLISFFWQPPLKELEPNELCLRNGVCRWCVCMMTAIAAVDILQENEINEIKNVLLTFGDLECSWDNERDISKTIYNSIGSKLCASVAQRPDPDQLLEDFEVIINLKKPGDIASGKMYTTSEYIHECANNYNETQLSKATKLDNYERCAVEWLSTQLPETRQTIKKIWAGPGKYTESGLNFHELSKECFRKGYLMSALVDANNAMWRNDTTTNSKGYYLFAMRAKNVFMANYEVAKTNSRKNTVNLKTAAKQLRDQDVEKALLLCTWWGAKEEELQLKLGDSYAEMLNRFLRGSAS